MKGYKVSKEIKLTSIQKLFSITHEITRDEGSEEILDLYTMVDYLRDIREDLEKLEVYYNSDPFKDLNDLSGLAWKYCKLKKIDKIGNENKTVSELCNTIILHLNNKKGNNNMETYDGTKTKRVIEEPLELLRLVMYGDEATGEQDQAYEDLKHYLKER